MSFECAACGFVISLLVAMIYAFIFKPSRNELRSPVIEAIAVFSSICFMILPSAVIGFYLDGLSGSLWSIFGSSFIALAGINDLRHCVVEMIEIIRENKIRS